MAVTALPTFSRFLHKWYYEPVLKPGQPPLPPGPLGWPVFINMAAFLRAFKSGLPYSFMGHFLVSEACKFVLSKDSFETGWPKSAVVLIGRNLFARLTEESYLKLQKLTESL
ncbi:hypothetical protein SELMODRAFT_428762 [Selaginella moellendorffii]|uniref:Uncharacterized protein n=1 Tax=Selaginella moellendorffii TaxID=88036 RepID=D8T3W8_SELML|nr:hypothetical protein SELMODRAFT_432177 [Selaginella moellendorffii]EFJ05976.1 hypothetical protein SELMODRAFT_431098 [Selaginella moellendorffii]EFJ08676.1 hypothetical protein SELMODRAFT_428762 [Selaginella moellendorffii]